MAMFATPPDVNGSTQLSLAAFLGKVDVMERLRAGEYQDADGVAHPPAVADEADEWGLRPLHWAVISIQQRSVRALLGDGFGADPNVRDKMGFAPLVYAAGRYLDRDNVDALLAAGAQVDLANAHNSTALHAAALLGHATSVEMLLAAGADWTLTDNDGNTARDLCKDPACQRLFEQARLRRAGLLDALGEPPADASPLVAAICGSADGDAEKALELCAGLAEPLAADQGVTPLHWACKHGKDAVVRTLLEAAGPDAAASLAPSVLLVATACNQRAAVLAVLDHKGPDGQPLFAKDAPIGDAAQKRTALHWGALCGCSEAVKALVESGCSTAAADADGKTAQDVALAGPRAILARAAAESQPTGPTTVCTGCGTTGSRMAQCARCLLAYYCSRDCQTSNWGAHKANCVRRVFVPPKQLTRTMEDPTPLSELDRSKFALADAPFPDAFVLKVQLPLGIPDGFPINEETVHMIAPLVYDQNKNFECQLKNLQTAQKLAATAAKQPQRKAYLWAHFAADREGFYICHTKKADQPDW